MRKDLVVFRCKNCSNELKSYNPYIYPNGKKVPLDKIEVVKVDENFCENNFFNLNHHPRLQGAIRLVNAPELPWTVKYWETIYDREQGISDIYGKYESFLEAKAAISDNGCAKYWATYEISLSTENEEYPVYVYANCRPFADEFLKNAALPDETATEIKITEKEIV